MPGHKCHKAQLSSLPSEPSSATYPGSPELVLQAMKDEASELPLLGYGTPSLLGVLCLLPGLGKG